MNKENYKTYTIDELAKILQLSKITIRRYIAKGLIKPITLNGAVRFSQEEIDRLLQS